jgi:hypothetical protein
MFLHHLLLALLARFEICDAPMFPNDAIESQSFV